MRRVVLRVGRRASAIMLAITTILAITATSAAATDEQSSKDASPSSDLFRADERGALARLKLAQSSPQPLAAIVYADINCYNVPFMYVKDKGWGVGAQANKQVDVYRDLFIDGQWWKTTENWPWTSSSGSWSTSTGEHATLIGSARYMLWVTAYYEATGSYIGRATDYCDM
ncbi:hypothetical protein [Micromonospora sediminicola]|uniref:hypothetical protein n=1 Tax=Micromonospora sediminicola TaxID=946078 RepID=UPI0037B35D27